MCQDVSRFVRICQDLSGSVRKCQDEKRVKKVKSVMRVKRVKRVKENILARQGKKCKRVKVVMTFNIYI